MSSGVFMSRGGESVTDTLIASIKLGLVNGERRRRRRSGDDCDRFVLAIGRRAPRLFRFRDDKFQFAREIKRAAKITLHLAAARLRQRAGTNERDVADDEIVNLEHSLANRRVQG